MPVKVTIQDLREEKEQKNRAVIYADRNNQINLDVVVHIAQSAIGLN